MKIIDIIKPSAPKGVLLFLAGFVWFCAGAMLLVHAYSWLSDVPFPQSLLYLALGISAALPIHHFGFQKIANKNVDRLLPITDKRCVFSFFTWKSYTLIIVMVTMGKLLRHSQLPKPCLAIIYTAIGLALILSSSKYIKALIKK